jgi:primosomal protein N' (replication factor Y)
MAQLFPHLTWIRFDSDTTRRKDAHRTLLTRFAQGEADLLVGTQMLTKGIDLPQVTLVGVLAADGLLHLPDFRSGERACQMLLQVAGRSGRGVDPGQVILQTYSPDHAVIEAVKTDRYGHFLEQQLQERSPLSYPPFSQLLLLRFSSLDPALVQTAATHIAEFLQDYVQDYLKGTSRFDPADPPSGLREMEEMQHPDIELLGPAPAPILRIAQRYRWQILLKVKPFAQESFRLPLAEIKTKIHQYRPTKVSLTIDVDPLQLM